MNFQGSPVVKTSPSNVGGEGSILSQEDKLSHALRPKSQTIKQKKYFNKLKKDLQTLKTYQWFETFPFSFLFFVKLF